jgi:ATP-dependent RNA helicase DDX5/DBP2
VRPGASGSSNGRDGTGLQTITDWSGASHFEKNFYQEHPAVTARTAEQVAAFRASKQIVVTGREPPKPCQTFEEGSFPDYILNVVEKEYGLQAAPTPVQVAQGLRH